MPLSEAEKYTLTALENGIMTDREMRTTYQAARRALIKRVHRADVKGLDLGIPVFPRLSEVKDLPAMLAEIMRYRLGARYTQAGLEEQWTRSRGTLQRHGYDMTGVNMRSFGRVMDLVRAAGADLQVSSSYVAQHYKELRNVRTVEGLKRRIDEILEQEGLRE